MLIKLYNSLSRKKEVFEPLKPGKVGIYACGVTVYDLCHLGHARGAINFDVMRNFFEASGYEVTYVKNYTDIDDKIIDRANQLKRSVKDLAKEMIHSHDQDMASLLIAPANIRPKATEHIEEILIMIKGLIEKGHAYESGGDVFFRVRSFEGYGKLSGKNIDELIAGSRIEVNSNKEDALDFVLWKAAKPGEPSWNSPWGEGRPGWHIECSAMSNKYLGKTFDIHAGGSDLLFPHHENEIAQSESCNSQPFARYWVHNGMVRIDNQKMSKSLGNFACIVDLIQTFRPELLRFFILSCQYRQALNFSPEALAQASEGLDRLYNALDRFERAHGEVTATLDKASQQRFMLAMADDLNTPQAMAILFETAKQLNSEIENPDKAAISYATLKTLGKILGLLQASGKEWFKSPRIKEQKEGLSDDGIDALVKARYQARQDKNWSEADRIRDELSKAGILIEDNPKGTLWRRK